MSCPYCSPSSLDHEEPCPRCLNYMKQGILVIAIHDDGTRAGPIAVLKEQAMLDVIKDEQTRKFVKEERAVLINTETWKLMGLPALS